MSPMHFLESLANGRNFVPFLIFAGIIIVVIVKTIGATVRSNSRERTRREIAAYIAEGTMTPEQGERLMRAGGHDTDRA